MVFFTPDSYYGSVEVTPFYKEPVDSSLRIIIELLSNFKSL